MKRLLAKFATVLLASVAPVELTRERRSVSSFRSGASFGLAFVAIMFLPLSSHAATLLGWNNLGMHCMDSDYSVFSILPPYNTIEAQLIVGGKLITNGAGYTLTYEAVADPVGSINSTAMGKGNFYDYSALLYGATLLPERGLAGWAMPGVFNVRQAMLFEETNRPAPGAATRVNWFRAEGIPISPYDDAYQKNPYPLMRIVAWNSANQPIATNDVVLPVSDEMDCRTCHASGTQSAARPLAGWAWSGMPERDYRLNILRLHDERQFQQHSNLFVAALAARGLNRAGLYRSVMMDGRPVLCAACHASEALGTASFGTIPPLTASMHSLHSDVMDPDLNLTLNNSSHRAACYRCHPGSTTRCLRGAMSAAVAPDGSMGIQCQNCHGNMKAVGSTNRVGWFMEPNCQSCHSGTATRNSGQIRYTSAFETNGTVRVPADFTFATQSNTPAPGISLYRFSAGHGGLQCSACHGSTHAEFPSTHLNDNVRNKALQGHKGVMVECSSCHTSQPATMTGGPHGMHPTVQDWVNGHGDLIEFGAATLAQCRPCHGLDYRGTVLSRAQGDHAVVGHFDNTNVTLSLFRGAIVGCYNCHNGAGENSVNTNAAPVVSNVTTNVSNDGVATFTVPTVGAGAAVRIVSQPGNGVVSGGIGNVFYYFPPAGFVGTDTFTFAAYNGSKNSNLGTGTIYVTQGIFSIGAVALVPSEHPALWPVPFNAVCWPTNISGTVSIDWNFGDSSPHGTNAHATHAYSLPGLYNWSVIARISAASVTNQGTILIQDCVALTATGGAGIIIKWPRSMCDTVLESSGSLGPAAHWMAVTNQPEPMGNQMKLIIAPDSASTFFRIRQAW